MNVRHVVGLFAAVVLAVSAAQAQTNVRVRGTITAISGNVMSVKSRDGKDLQIAIPDNVAVAVAKNVRFEDIKEGDFVGVTSKPGPDGTEVAIEVHYLAPTTAPGQSAWDLQPNTKMTNANVQAKVVGTGNHELTLQYTGGTQKVVVPDGIPLVRAVPGTRADLVTGEYIFTVAQAAGDGALSAPRVQVSKDGVRPPQ